MYFSIPIKRILLWIIVPDSLSNFFSKLDFFDGFYLFLLFILKGENNGSVAAVLRFKCIVPSSFEKLFYKCFDPFQVTRIAKNKKILEI